jgi:hypothetical protein
MPIVVGTVVPLVIAIVVLIFLHRRHVKKLRQEDAEDKHGSLDFGLGEGRRPQHNKSKRWKKQPPTPQPQMSMRDAHNALRKERGLSLDMTQSPYLLPPGLQHSRESLHSMSRSQTLGDDKYGRTDFIPDDGSIRSPTIRRGGDDSSSFSGSTRYRTDAESSRSLIHTNGGLPPRPAPPPKSYSPVPEAREMPSNLLAPKQADARESTISTISNTAAFRASNNYLSSFIRGGQKGDDKKDVKSDSKQQHEVSVTEKEVLPTPPEQDSRSPAPALPAIVMNEPPLEHARLSEYSNHPAPPPEPQEQEPQRPARTTSMAADREPQIPQFSVMDYDSQQNSPDDRSREPSTYGQPNQQTTQVNSRETSQYDRNYSQQPDAAHSREQSQGLQSYQQYDDEDDYYDPEDTYSVYDDYGEDQMYDRRRSTFGLRPLPPDDPSENPEQRANRIRSFYKEYFDESGKPGGGNVSQYYDGSEEFYDDYYEEDYYNYPPPRGMSAAGGRHRAMSNGSYMSHGGPRAFSSASGRYGRPMPPRGGPRGPPKRRAPPPKALNELPTPSKLKDDTFLIDMAVDFAPPDRAKFQRSGTPSSPRGGQRPFSPAVRAFTPLQSSYDDLAVLPSP